MVSGHFWQANYLNLCNYSILTERGVHPCRIALYDVRFIHGFHSSLIPPASIDVLRVIFKSNSYINPSQALPRETGQALKGSVFGLPSPDLRHPTSDIGPPSSEAVLKQNLPLISQNYAEDFNDVLIFYLTIAEIIY